MPGAMEPEAPHASERDAPPATGVLAVVTKAVCDELARLDPTDHGTPQEATQLRAVSDALVYRATLDDQLASRRAEAHLPPLTDLVASDPDSEDARHAIRRLRRIELGELPDDDTIELPDGPPATTVDVRTVATYLRAHGLDRDVAEVRMLAGGFSKETLLVRLHPSNSPGTGPDAVRDVIIRKVAKGRTADTLPGEYEVVRFAAEHGLPAPRPYWLDTSDNVVGGPLFVTERMAGRTVGTVNGPAADATEETARQLAELLGQLHAIDPTGLDATPRPPMASPEDVRAALDQRAAIVDQVADSMPDTPGLVLHRAVLAWLRNHIPVFGVRPVLVHGDIGFHNILVSEGSITALLDWEMAHHGLAAEDLAYVRPSVRQLIDWPEFLAHYTAAGGRPADEDELRFFTVWQNVWRANSCLRLRTKFLSDPSRLSDGVSGLLLGPRFLDNALSAAFGDKD